MLLRDYKCGLVVDATTKRNGQNHSALREISKLSGINLCFGYTLKEDFFSDVQNFNFEKVLNEIRYEIVYGYDDYIPSFLGEIIISESNLFPNSNEEKLFDILFKVVQEFQIPLFIKLNHSSLISNSRSVFEYFEKKCDEHKLNKKLLVFIYTKSDSESKLEEEIPSIQDNILSKGFSLIIGLYDCDLVYANKLKNNEIEINFENFSKITPFYYKDKLNFILDLLKLENKKYIPQIMISNNVNFRIQLKRYGGFGYTNLFRNYFNKITIGAELTDEEISSVFSENLLNLLSWWVPPQKSQKKVKYITCSNCGKQEEESENIFRKLENVYCTIKCLKEHSIKLSK